MKYSIGDAVFLKRTSEEGRVTRILSAAMLEVEVGGVAFPVYADEVEHPYLRWFTGKTGRPRKALPPELPAPEKKAPPRLARAAYLAFMPQYDVEDVTTGAKIHLVNELPHDLRFRYDVRDTRRHRLFSLEGMVPAFSNFYLHDLPWDALAANPRLAWHLVPVYEGQLGPAESGVLRLRPLHLARRMDALQESGDPSFYEQLVDTFLDRVDAPLPLPRFIPAAGAVPVVVVPERLELDLHAETLLGDTTGMQPSEVLHHQLQALQHFLQTAAAQQLPLVTIIHGIGSGMLRKAVQQVLQESPEVARISADWHPRFGFGATQAWLKQA